MGLLQRFKEWWQSPLPEPQRTTYVPPELFQEIHRLKEQADWIGRLIEDEERAFTYGEDGTIQFGSSQGQPNEMMFDYKWAYSQALFRPGYFAAFCINETQHRIIRARSRAFCSINPYWHGVQHNLKTHVAGKGHKWTLVLRDPKQKPPKEKREKAQQEIDDFYDGTGDYTGTGGYRHVQQEKLDRKSRDGEYFLQYVTDNARLRVRFVEPLLVWTPASKSEQDEVWFGIQFKRGDYERPLGYYVRRTNLLGADNSDQSAWDRMIDASEIQHRKVNVDRSSPRGIPDTYWVQGRLEQSMRTLRAMGTLVQVRTKIALIRKRVNALAGSVQPMLSANAMTSIAGPGGQIRNISQYPEGAILDTSDQAEYQFPNQNIETDKIVASIQADLQAVATSVGLADYMVSGALNKGSFATAMVAEGPVVKTFEQHQEDMVEEDREVATRVLEVAMEAALLDEDTLELFKLEMTGPPLARQGIQEAQANQIKVQCGVLSVTTWQQREGLDSETEAANIKTNPSPLTMAATAGGDGTQPRNRQTDNARPFSASEEPRQVQRASGATREEERNEQYYGGYTLKEAEQQLAKALSDSDAYSDGGQYVSIQQWRVKGLRKLQESRLREHSSDDRAAMQPTQEDLAMAGLWITPEWLSTRKSEILSLPAGPRGMNQAYGEYEPGVRGIYLGLVDGQQVWAIDMRAMVVKYSCPDLICAGNSEKWPFVPADKIIVDWSFVPYDRGLNVLHECIEYTLMLQGKLAYARAHRVSNYYEDQWLLEMRPELSVLKPGA